MRVWESARSTRREQRSEGYDKEAMDAMQELLGFLVDTGRFFNRQQVVAVSFAMTLAC